MLKNSKKPEYDLEERTIVFAKSVRDFLKQVPKSAINNEYIKQLVRSSGSVGANYIEANESLGKKDFVMKLKISRKEIKESRYWLDLIEVDASENTRLSLVKEAKELLLIFSAIIRKLEN